MDFLQLPDWAELLLPDTPIIEIVFRGTVMYLGMFVLLRVIQRREVGMVGIPDILMIVLLADAAQNGMAGDYKSISDGLLLVAVIVIWNLAIDRLAYHVPAIGRFVHPKSLALIRDGRLLRENLRREAITWDELWTELHAAGISELCQVKAAFIEGTGEISVIRTDGKEPAKKMKRGPV